MKSGTVMLAVICSIIYCTAAFAQTSVLERLANMEKRIQYLEKRVSSQDQVIVQKDREIARLKKGDEEKSGKWFNKINLTGGVELEVSRGDPYTGDATSDAKVSTATIGLTTQIHDWVGAEISLLYEEDDTPLEIDTASPYTHIVHEDAPTTYAYRACWVDTKRNKGPYGDPAVCTGTV